MSRWREGAGCSRDLGFLSSGVASPGAKELQVVMSPPGGICPWARWSQGFGVPALRAHRDLPALALSLMAPRRERGREGGHRFAPAQTSPAAGQTDRQEDAVVLARGRVGRVAGIPRVEAASGRGG